MVSKAVGIDLGTTNSSMAIVIDGKPYEGEFLMPGVKYRFVVKQNDEKSFYLSHPSPTDFGFWISIGQIQG